MEVALSLSRSNDEYRESYANVHQETIRMTGFIDNLLMLARADAGAEALRFETRGRSAIGAPSTEEKWNACYVCKRSGISIEIGSSRSLCDAIS